MPFPHIPEIIGLICSNLVDIRRKATLVSLAMTCSSLKEPALDALWSDLKGFYPLANCLPTEIDHHQDGEKWMNLSRPITLADCSRMTYYASKIHRFTVHSYSYKLPQIHPDIYHDLHIAMLGAKLLPNIRHLTWDTEVHSYTVLHMFLGPRLSGIELAFYPLNNGELSIIPSLLHLYPSLEEIKLSTTELGRMGEDDEDMKRATIKLISNTVGAWSSLRSLSLPNITYATLCDISRLPWLKKLEINDRYSLGNIVIQSAKAPERGFSALNSLHIPNCTTVSDLIALLNLMDNSPLLSIIVYFRQVTLTTTTWGQVFHTINDHCDHRTLQCLEFRDGESTGTQAIIPPLSMIKYDDLHPLLVFRRLKRIDIAATYGFHFPDPVVIARMASSWTQIRVLKLRLRPFSRTQRKGKSKITPSDLVPFAKYCRQLKELAIPLDATSPPKISAGFPWSGKIPKTKLTTLYVGDSPIRNASLVGANLSAIFSSLYAIYTIEREESWVHFQRLENSSRHAKWEMAEKRMKQYSRVRKQERMHAEARYEVLSSDEADDIANPLSTEGGRKLLDLEISDQSTDVSSSGSESEGSDDS